MSLNCFTIPIKMNCCYVLELTDDKIYVGISTNFQNRIQSHVAARLGILDPIYKNKPGSAFTRLHTVVKIKALYPGEANLDFEDKKTLELMKKYGIENVRGGKFHRPVLYKRMLKVIENKI